MLRMKQCESEYVTATSPVYRRRLCSGSTVGGEERAAKADQVWRTKRDTIMQPGLLIFSCISLTLPAHYGSVTYNAEIEVGTSTVRDSCLRPREGTYGTSTHQRFDRTDILVLHINYWNLTRLTMQHQRLLHVLLFTSERRRRYTSARISPCWPRETT
jgi:hypothetical protein